MSNGQGRTRCAVIGHPVEHSLSPVIHREAYAALGLDWTYDRVDVEPGGVRAFVAGLDATWRGLSVTMPHKEEIARLGEPDDVVRQTEVANTWVRTGEGAIVRNTDVSGYRIALAAHGIDRVGHAVVVGNGATARSALVAMARLGARTVTVLARDPARAAGLVSVGTAMGVDVPVSVLGHPVPSAELVCSTVPTAGVEPVAEMLAAAAPVVFDSVYDPWPTPLATAGAAAGRLVMNGLDLLAGQAVDQVRWMTGELVTFELLRGAAQRAIDARATGR